VLTVIHYKATTYGKSTLMSISLHIDILHIKSVQNLFNQNCLLLHQFHYYHVHHRLLHLIEDRQSYHLHRFMYVHWFSIYHLTPRHQHQHQQKYSQQQENLNFLLNR